MEVEKPDKQHASTGGTKCALGFEVYVRVGTEQVSVGCRWLEGHDAGLFESFQGCLKATVQATLGSKT